MDFTIPMLCFAITIYRLHAPKIDILSDTKATDIWALDYNLWRPEVISRFAKPPLP